MLTGVETVRAGLISATAGMAALLMLAAGCSDKQGGTALPVTTTTTAESTTTQTPGRSSTAPSNTGGAPRVTNPVEATKFLAQPCAALSTSALQAMKIGKPGAPDTESAVAKSSGPFCIWHSDESSSKTYSVGFLTGNKNGLSDTYRGGKKAFPGYFEPAEVDGYPAVFNDLVDDRSDGSCNVTVGISDAMAFRVGVQADKATGTKSCDIVKQTASSVITTLKGA